MNPDDLFAYAKEFHSSSNYRQLARYPTVAQCAKHFKVSQSEIVGAVDNYEGEDYLGLAVALGCGDMVYDIPSERDYLVEAYDA